MPVPSLSVAQNTRYCQWAVYCSLRRQGAFSSLWLCQSVC